MPSFNNKIVGDVDYKHPRYNDKAEMQNAAYCRVLQKRKHISPKVMQYLHDICVVSYFD